jgi:charged multivesicular body protein 1
VQNSIREKGQALNYLRLSSRMDAVAARVETAVRMNTLSATMTGVVKSMDGVLGAMEPEKVCARC